MRTYRHYGFIKDGQKHYLNPELLAISLAELEGKDFEEVIQKRKQTASKNQYGYLFGGIIPEALTYETFGGWDEKDLQKFFEHRFLSYTVIKDIKLANGQKVSKTIYYPGSFKGLDKDEMTIVIEKIIRFLAEQGIVIKSSDSYNYGRYQQVSKGTKSSDSNS